MIYKAFKFCQVLVLGLSATGTLLVAQVDIEKSKSPQARCALCEKRIIGNYYQLRGLMELYCEECHQRQPKCFYCGKPFLPKNHSSPHPPSPVGQGDHPVCPACTTTQIHTVTQATEIAMKVQRWLTWNLKMNFPVTIRWSFTNDLTQEAQVPLSGQSREMGIFVRSADQYKVCILKGLPRELLIETIAHELAHVWTAENAPPQQTLFLKEGFAQWVAAKVLTHFQCHQSLQVLTHREDLYGQAYRFFKKKEGKEGVKGIITFAREAKSE
jgi:hypothetical protein